MRSARSLCLSCLVLTCTSSLLIATGCSSTPTPTVVLKQKADRDFEYEQWEKAAELYAEIVNREPHDGDAQYHYGVSLMHLKQYTKAENALRTAHALDPQSDEIAFALAEVLN